MFSRKFLSAVIIGLCALLFSAGNLWAGEYEVGESGEDTRDKILEAIKDIEFEELEISKEVRVLADKYVEEGVIPVKYLDDALHVAVASINDVDVVISWNFDHLVKHKTRVEVMGINTFMGYRTIDICSPKEVVDDV